MPQAQMSEDRSFDPTDDPPVVTVLGGFLDPLDALGPPGFLGTRDNVEKELDLIAAAIRVFHRKQADQVMRECSGYSARLTELEVLLHRHEGESRQWTRVRTQQVHKFLEEIDRQWKTASRLIEVQRQDLELLR